jgi:protein-S-isoprenylcysteine O-methyltransferase Ste14
MHVFTVIIGWAWIAFWLYWIISAFQSKKNTASQTATFVMTRLAIITLAAVLGLLFSRVPPSISQDYSALVQNNVALIFGFIVFSAGVYLAVWARFALGASWGMPMTRKQDPQLVTSGIYTYVRHPIYSDPPSLLT